MVLFMVSFLYIGAVPLVNMDYHEFREDKPNTINEILFPFNIAFSRTNSTIMTKDTLQNTGTYDDKIPTKYNYMRKRNTLKELRNPIKIKNLEFERVNSKF